MSDPVANLIEELQEEIRLLRQSQSIKVGKYALTPLDNKHIWISMADGEGGGFPTKQLESVIAEFYKANF